MKKNIILASFITTFLGISSAFAAFEYNGVFAAKRSNNEAQAYYILLNENTNVIFSLKSDGKETKEVFVSSIKLTSDESININSKSGINSYKVTATGIYEVSVSSNASLDKAINYELLVNSEETKKTDSSPNESETLNNNISPQVSNNSSNSNKSSINNLQTNTENQPVNNNSNSFSSIGSARIVDSDETNVNSNKTNDKISENIKESEIKLEKPLENVTTISESVKKEEEPIVKEIAITSSQTEIEKPKTSTEESLETKAVAAPLNSNTEKTESFDFSQLDPDTPAVEADEDTQETNTFVEKKKISYKGKLQLSGSIDAYRFLGDKNKCWPQAICYDNNNNLWILDGQLNRITCYNSKGIEVSSFGSKGKLKNELGIPISLALFKNYVLVGDRQKNCIHIFNKNGEWLNAIQSDPNVGLKISNPVSICIRNNEIWVADSRINRVMCFDSNFSFLGSFGSTKESRIDSISAISTDGEYIYILEEEGVLKKFGTMGNFLSAFPTDIKYSTGLFVDGNKNIWITDIEQGRVICYSNDEGKTLFSIDRKSLSGLFAGSDKFAPSSVFISLSAKIAVADTNSKQVKIFDITSSTSK